MKEEEEEEEEEDGTSQFRFNSSAGFLYAGWRGTVVLADSVIRREQRESGPD